MVNVDYTQVMKHKTAYFSHEEIESMLNFCYNNNRIRDYVLIYILLHTGRRITEILGERPYTKKKGLRPVDIRDDGLIEFDILKKNPIKLKNKKKISVESLNRLRLEKEPQRRLKPIDNDAMILLKEYVKAKNIHPYERVFPITRQRFDAIIKQIAKECNIFRDKYKIHAHMFRHSFSIIILKKNPNNVAVLRQVQELLEHSSINVTMNTYAQFTQEDKKETLNKTFGDD